MWYEYDLQLTFTEMSVTSLNLSLDKPISTHYSLNAAGGQNNTQLDLT